MPQRGGPHAPVCLNRGAVGEKKAMNRAFASETGTNGQDAWHFWCHCGAYIDTPMHNGRIQSRGRIDEIGRSYGPGHVHVGSTQPHLTETMDTKFSHAEST